MTSISIKNLAEAIYESSLGKDGGDLDSVIEKSCIFIRNKNLLGKKEEILEALEKLIDKKEGVVRVAVSTSNKLTKEDQREIEEFIIKKYKAKTVNLELREDKRLLGGIKIEIGDDIIDTTLSNKIHQLQNYLITN